MLNLRFSTRLLPLVVVVFGTNIVCAQGYPNKPVRIVVGFPPGGATDFIARIVAQKLAPVFGQQVIVDNRPGASGNIAAELTAKAPPDGYTLVMVAASHATNPSLYRQLSFNTVKDFAAITQVSEEAYVLVVHPSVPAKTVKDFVALAKSRNGRLTYASSGNGLSSHLGMELFKTRAGFDAVHIPFKGAAPAIVALLAGEVDAFTPPLVVGLTHVNAGKVRALGITSANRSPLMRDVPTIAESGYSGFEVNGWYGLLAPAGTPKEIITKLQAGVAALLKLPDVRKRMVATGEEPIGSSSEGFSAYISTEMTRWAKVIQQSGAKID